MTDLAADLTSRSLGDLVAANPAAARLLDRLGLDYCCHGERSLRDACQEAGLDVGDVAALLGDLAVEGDATWTGLDPVELADHIVATHHAYLREELPLLEALAAKVRDVHGERHPELAEVARLVSEVRADLEPHLDAEELELFPAIRTLAEGGAGEVAAAARATIERMRGDHDRVGELLATLRRTTGAFAAPADACASYLSLYERLETLEHDTHLHVHKENHALFPAALALAG